MRHSLYMACIAASVLLLPSVVMADMDYRCLKDCKRDGKEYSACAQECTYIPKSSFRNDKPAVAAAANDDHNPFTAPQPVNENALLPPKEKSTHANETTDYACAAKCQQSGWQFELCEKRCTKPADLSSLTGKTDKVRNARQETSYSPARP